MAHHDEARRARTRRRAIAAGIALAAALQPSCARRGPEREVLVFAAASLADALEEVGRVHEERTGVGVRFSFAGSRTLARQVLAGAPADAVASADLEPMDALVAAGRVAPGSVRAFAGNALVVAVPAASSLEVRGARSLAGLTRIAMADPETAPAGVHARAWLEDQGVWEAVQGALVPTADVRAALAAAASGRVEAALVYATDVRSSPAVREAYRVPPDPVRPVAYVAAPVTGGRIALAEGFLGTLASERGRSVLRTHGFTEAPAPP